MGMRRQILAASLECPTCLDTPCGMKQSTLRPARWQRGRPLLGAEEPVSECDPESREHPVLSPRLRR